MRSANTVLKRWNLETAIVLLVSVALASCSPSLKQQDEAIRQSLASVQATHAPDKRVAVFEIAWSRVGADIVVKGEVGDLSAKDDALAAFSKNAAGQIVDSVKVLPGQDLGDARFGIVAVSVGNMRGKPQHPAELVTQVLMGTVMKILKKEGSWYYVQAPDRYLGWLDRDAMALVDQNGVDAWIGASKVIVTDYFGVVRQKPDGKSYPVSDVVMGGLLGKRSETVRLGGRGGWTEVQLPDGRRGYVEWQIVQDYATWKRDRKLDGNRVEQVARLFVGVPYLWGGTSAKGFDCSGFTKIVYRLNGLDLNRDADQQAMMGDVVTAGEDFRGLKKGDLLFFGRKATEERPERIWHVGIYLGQQEFIHCAGKVRVNSFDPTHPNFDEERLRTYVRSRRLIGISQVPETL